MPRRSVLSASERDSLLAPPEDESELIRYYTFSETDHALIRQRRGVANRFGFAVQLCLLRYPGTVLSRNKAIAMRHGVNIYRSSWRTLGSRRSACPSSAHW